MVVPIRSKFSTLLIPMISAKKRGLDLWSLSRPSPLTSVDIGGGNFRVLGALRQHGVVFVPRRLVLLQHSLWRCDIIMQAMRIINGSARLQKLAGCCYGRALTISRTRGKHEAAFGSGCESHVSTQRRGEFNHDFCSKHLTTYARGIHVSLAHWKDGASVTGEIAECYYDWSFRDDDSNNRLLWYVTSFLN